MNDPYQILNIPPTATDEEVKRAYRDLARKYHPDNYHDNPLADLAQEKMKEINEAYDQIQKQRKASSAAAKERAARPCRAAAQTRAVIKIGRVDRAEAVGPVARPRQRRERVLIFV